MIPSPIDVPAAATTSANSVHTGISLSSTSTSITTTSTSITTSTSNLEDVVQRGIRNFLQSSISADTMLPPALLVPPANAADDTTTTSSSSPLPPTNEEIKLLRNALGAIYGERNPQKASQLLSQAISAWERQPPDERAALYRVRGDCYMELLDAKAALQDYTTTLSLLTGPGGELADPEELPAAYLGHARALRSLPDAVLSKEQYQTASRDYQMAMRLTSREEWDTNEELEQDGARRNPYAAWEWGMALRGEGEYQKAAQVHLLASSTFKDIGDRARSVISKLDAGIDLASAAADVGTSSSSSSSSSGSGSDKDVMEQAMKVLQEGIDSTTSVEGRDVELLQRVIAKEGEARIALASILWSNNQKSVAEAQLGEACGRLEQLQADADARERVAAAAAAASGKTIVKVKKLPFTIDDTVGTECSCSRFKNSKFLDSLLWPAPLQDKVSKLNKLVS